jgi:L-lactate dehydrogenase
MISKKVKITIVGAGAIGSTILYTLMLKNIANEIVLVNRNKSKAKAKAYDISHCTGFSGNAEIISGDYEQSENSDIVIITAGVLPEENGTRMDVLNANIKIYKDIIPEIVKYNPDCVLLILTNPVDVMAYAAWKISGLDSSRVIGTGTLLDTMRLKKFLGEMFKTNPANIETLIIGEHGDSQLPLWSSTKISETCMEEYLDEDLKNSLEIKTKRAGWDIRIANEHSCYAISFCAVMITEAILEKSDIPLPVSVLLNGQYGIKDIYLSLPAKLSSEGVKKIIEPKLDDFELKRLKKSANILGEYIAEADKYL